MEASHSKSERSRRARDKMVLRKELPNILGFVGGILGDTEHAHGLLAGSKDIPDYLAKIADAAEPKSGTESVMSVEVLGLLSDVALVKMTRAEKTQNLLDTPSQIVLWFRDYLVRTLDKKDLDWLQNNLKVGDGTARFKLSTGALDCS